MRTRINWFCSKIAVCVVVWCDVMFYADSILYKGWEVKASGILRKYLSHTFPPQRTAWKRDCQIGDISSDSNQLSSKMEVCGTFILLWIASDLLGRILREFHKYIVGAGRKFRVKNLIASLMSCCCSLSGIS